VGLAKLMSPALEQLVLDLQAPKSVVGIVIALIVLMPRPGPRSAPHAPTGCRQA
jgi:hypothetical protein